MMADVFIRETTRQKAEGRLKEHLARAGWNISEVQHWELMTGDPVHDCRMSGLYKTARSGGLAAEFSVY